jgi:hypothetical protein
VQGNLRIKDILRTLMIATDDFGKQKEKQRAEASLARKLSLTWMQLLVWSCDMLQQTHNNAPTGSGRCKLWSIQNVPDDRQ